MLLFGKENKEKMVEFDLSEAEFNLEFGDGEWYRAKDVKEFIRLLKKTFEETTDESLYLNAVIDRLAGDLAK